MENLNTTKSHSSFCTNLIAGSKNVSALGCSWRVFDQGGVYIFGIVVSFLFPGMWMPCGCTLTALADASLLHQIQELKIHFSRGQATLVSNHPIRIPKRPKTFHCFFAHIPKSTVTCSWEAAACQKIWLLPLLLQQKYKSSSELDLPEQRAGKINKQEKCLLLTAFLFLGFSLAWTTGSSWWQSSVVSSLAWAPQCPSPSCGLGVHVCNWVLECCISEAALPFPTTAVVSPGATLLPSLLHTPAAPALQIAEMWQRCIGFLGCWM